MIRTHRPRGFAWTCPSAFQQTELFRQINYEDCLVDNDFEDDNVFLTSGRDAKRRRIETLADNFLNGQSLHISSARPGPQSFTNAVCRSFRRPKDGRAALSEARVPLGSDETIWEDVQDDWEILRDFNQQREIIDSDSDGSELDDSLVIDDGDANVTTTVTHAQASCTSARKARAVRLAIAPSQEALRQAAELRDRNGRRKSARLSAPQESLQDGNHETQGDSTATSISESISVIGPTPTAAWTSSKWIKSGLLELRRKAVDEECSKDELGFSSLASPSQRKGSRTTGDRRPARGAASQAEPNPSSAANQSLDQNTEMLASFSGAITGTDPSAGTVFETAPEEAHSVLASIGQTDSPGDGGYSQNRLLRGGGLHVSPRRSWAPVNTNSTESQNIAVPDSAVSPQNVPTVSPDVRRAILESSQQNAGKSKAKRATKSTGTVMGPPPRRSTRRQSAPSQSQTPGFDALESLHVLADRPEREDYTAAPSKDSSPFLFRKGTSRSKPSATTERANRNTRSRKGGFGGNPIEDTPLSNNNTTAAEVSHTKTVFAKTPRRRVDFSSTSQATGVVQTSTTPLTDQHLNQVLPTDPKRRTSIRKSLRQELLKSGAEMSHVNDDLTLDTSHGTSTELSQLQLWPGTQVLLAKAQTDLFTSPDKPNPIESAAYPSAITTPHAAANQQTRGPLKTLSQERANVPLPSTQALIDNWQGWSSVKKPRRESDDLKRKSLILSPTVLRRLGSSEEARRSSLRFEMDLSGIEGEEEESQTLSHSEGLAADQEITSIPQSLPIAGMATDQTSSIQAVRSSDQRMAANSSFPPSSNLPSNRRPHPFAAHRPLLPLSSDHNFQVPSSLSLHGGLSSLPLPLPTGPNNLSKDSAKSSAANHIETDENETSHLRLSFQQAQGWDEPSFGFDSTTEIVTGTLPHQQTSGQESQTEVEMNLRKRRLDGMSQLESDVDGLVREVLVDSMEGYLGGESF